MQRRNFIKQSTIATGSLLVHNSFSAFAGASAPGKIKVGIIGCGDRGKGLMEVLNEMPDRFTITSICDIHDFRLGEAKKINAGTTLKEYTDYRKLLDDKQVQAVVIATPLYLHYAMAADALKAGKHLFLEKTMTFTIPQAIDLVKLAAVHSNQVVQIGHQLPYTPLYIKVKEMIQKGYLGKVTQIDCRYDRNGSWRRPVPDPSLERSINWRMYKEYSGGLTAEILSHQIEFVNWAFDTHPDEVSSTGGIDFYKDGRETFDNVQVMLRYNKDNMTGNFGATCANAREGYVCRIKGSKGTVELLQSDGVYYPEPATKKELQTIDGVTGATKIEWKTGGGIAIVKEPLKDATWYALQDFFKCISERKKPLCDVVTGATAAITVALSNFALYSKTIQEWKDDYNL